MSLPTLKVTLNMDRTAPVITDVIQERIRQDLKWGEPKRQPDGTGPERRPLRGIAVAHEDFHGGDPLDPAQATAKQLEEFAKDAINKSARIGSVTFAEILLEEVFEALAESDRAKLRAELVQVAAVAVKWVEVLDREAAAE